MKAWQRAAAAACVVGSLAAALSGCVPLVVTGGAVTAAMVASDRRTAGMLLEDQRIEQAMATKVSELTDPGRIHTTSFNRIVLLAGEVRSEQDKQRIGQLAQSIENVRSVVNELQVVPFVSSITQRTKDTFITSKVKASLIDAKDLQANAIKVVTEMNVVYLMGIVTPREAKRAAEIARGVNDVRKVVRVFESISEDELASYQTQPASAAPVQDAQPTYNSN